MEDKGLEEGRSHNIQNVLLQRLRELTGEVAEPDYQVIIATSMISPELNRPEYTIGQEYIESNKSLKHV